MDSKSYSKKIAYVRNRLPKTMLKDRYSIQKSLARLSRRIKTDGFGYKDLQKITSLENRLHKAMKRRNLRLENRPTVTYPSHLPISRKAQEIIRSIQDHQVVIIAGDTGSGKSTQIPKMCLDAGRGVDGTIGCTQPRRIAATTIARRIAEELGEEIGQSVGFKIRFSDRTSPAGYIKIMTDGMLLAETHEDPELSEYDTLIIDEAHERSLNIDFLLGILRTILRRRMDLKVIITSATLDTQKFSEAFGNAPVITIHGRLYPVRVEYVQPEQNLDDRGETNYVELSVKVTERLLNKTKVGDILVFMPTEQDILETCELLEGRKVEGVTVLPLYARLSENQQRRVFAPGQGRKIVVATNVAETSLTIPGIQYVVDTGLARISQYLPRTRIHSLPISPVSKSSAEQRKGRCGRIADGVCIRLYSEEDFEARPLFTDPELLRSNLAEVILKMVSLGLGDIRAFPFLDRPSDKSIRDGFDLLFELGAITKKGPRTSLTDKGALMSCMPLDPKISRMLIEAMKESCLPQMVVIASALSIQDPRQRPADQASEADQAHAVFRDPDSDFLTLLNIWNHYHRALKALKSQNKMRRFCHDHFLSYVRMREWRHVHSQITTILKEQKLAPGKGSGNLVESPLYDRIHRAILSGFLSNIGTKKENNLFLAARHREAMIFPGSSLFKRPPQWIVAAEMVKTSRLFARTVGKIDPQWLEPLGGALCKSSYSDPHWEKNQGAVMAYEQVSLYGLIIVSRRAIPYGSIDPVLSHQIFIHAALVQGDLKGSYPFLDHNRALIKKIGRMEDKMRRRNILVDEEKVAAFYSRKLSGVADVTGLRKLIKREGHDKFLKLEEKDLLLMTPKKEELARYPDEMRIDNKAYPLSYRFIPGSDADGVTVKVPSTMASHIPPEELDWVVPGLLEEKFTALIKGLPKRFRKQLVPVSETVRVLLSEMKKSNQPLVSALSEFVYHRFGVDIPASVWPEPEAIADHLKMRVSLLDAEGKELIAGRDSGLLQVSPSGRNTGEMDTDTWKMARKKWERTGIQSWNFEDLPKHFPLGPHLVAYPALVSEKEGIALRLFAQPEEALENHKRGVAALFHIRFRKDLKFLKRTLTIPKEGHEGATHFGGHRSLEEKVFNAAIKHLFFHDIRTKENFFSCRESLQGEIMATGQSFLDHALQVVLEYHNTRKILSDLESANRSNSDLMKLISGIRQDLEFLVPLDFLDRYDLLRLEQLPRYMKALALRAQRAAVDLSKDLKKTAEIAPFVDAFRAMAEAVSARTTEEKKNALEMYRWMIEEFKVSLFAQELKTAFPISAVRLKKKMREIDRMI